MGKTDENIFKDILNFMGKTDENILNFGFSIGNPT